MAFSLVVFRNGMSKTRLYWILQVVGWTTLVMSEFVFYSLEYGWDSSTFFLSLANILLCIILTHFYRLIIRKWNISSISLAVLGFRMLLSVAVLGLAMSLFTMPLDLEVLSANVTDTPYLFWGYVIGWCKSMMAWVLSYTVYHYVEQKRLTDLERIMLKTSMREAEAKVLRAQLNPHFTFNALNSIRALILENPVKAQQTVTQLSNILRNSLLTDRRKTVELREELKTVEDYLELEKVRYEERLKFSIEAEPQVMFWQVPPMMLQTLVENGIKHGVARLTGGGFLQLSATQQNDSLFIRIRNSGELTGTSSGGIGLQNTAERLSILYGKEADFSIFQESEGVVCAELRMPVMSEGMQRYHDSGKPVRRSS